MVGEVKETKAYEVDGELFATLEEADEHVARAVYAEAVDVMIGRLVDCAGLHGVEAQHVGDYLRENPNQVRQLAHAAGSLL